MKYTVYILYSEKFAKYYIGQTNNLEIKIEQHNEGKSIFTSKYRPWKIIYQKDFKSRPEALRLERYLKSLKNKERIKEYIAGWRSSTLPGS